MVQAPPTNQRAPEKPQNAADVGSLSHRERAGVRGKNASFILSAFGFVALAASVGVADQKISPSDLQSWVKLAPPEPRTTGSDAAHTYPSNREKGKKHWAYQPVKKPAVPEVPDPQHWIKTPIDSFILAAQQAHNLTPSPPADKVTL